MGALYKASLRKKITKTTKDEEKYRAKLEAIQDEKKLDCSKFLDDIEPATIYSLFKLLESTCHNCQKDGIIELRNNYEKGRLSHGEMLHIMDLLDKNQHEFSKMVFPNKEE